MQRLQVFISYSDLDKLIAGKLKEYLITYCGYNAFLAHEDMVPSKNFKEEIIKKIKKMDVFVPLISQNFVTSAYADQEVGIAIAEKRKIIPISIDLNPYGFISDYHALKYRDDLKNLAITIGLLVVKNFPNKYQKKAKDSIVKALDGSLHFVDSNVIISILCECQNLNTEQLDSIQKSIKNNSQVKGAYGLGDLRKMLKIKYGIDA